MANRFEGKSVVVTGASSGMGREIALEFAAEGATVVAVARRMERLEELAAQAEGLSGTILPYPGDISSVEVNNGMIDYAVEKCGKLDILVNNAGIMDEFKPIAEVTDEQWERVMKVNLDGPMFAMRRAVEVMLGHGTAGSIVNVASIEPEPHIQPPSTRSSASPRIPLTCMRPTISAATSFARAELRPRLWTANPI